MRELFAPKTCAQMYSDPQLPVEKIEVDLAEERARRDAVQGVAAQSGAQDERELQQMLEPPVPLRPA